METYLIVWSSCVYPPQKWWSFRFLPVIVKNSFIWQIFLVLTNTNYLFLCLIYSKENWAVTNLGYIDIYYTMKRPVEHAILSFLAFSLFPKRLIFQVLLSQKKKFDLQTFHIKMFTWIFKKNPLSCLLFLHSGNMKFHFSNF